MSSNSIVEHKATLQWNGDCSKLTGQHKRGDKPILFFRKVSFDALRIKRARLLAANGIETKIPLLACIAYPFTVTVCPISKNGRAGPALSIPTGYLIHTDTLELLGEKHKYISFKPISRRFHLDGQARAACLRCQCNQLNDIVVSKTGCISSTPIPQLTLRKNTGNWSQTNLNSIQIDISPKNNKGAL